MKTTMDAAGRVVIPKPVRERLGLSAGEVLELREREGWIELEPAATSMSLTKTEGGLAAVPERRLPPLTDDIVRATLERYGVDRRRPLRAAHLAAAQTERSEGR